MTGLNEHTEQTLRMLLDEAETLRQRILDVYRETDYEDLEHAGLGLEIVRHAIDEVLAHTGLGGDISPVSEPEVHRQAEGWRSAVETIRREAGQLLETHANEDLETAIKALTVAAGSLEEVSERYA